MAAPTASSSSSPEPRARLTREVIHLLGKRLPPSFGILGKLQSVLRDPNSSVNEIVELIRVDPVLTSQVIKESNSAYYSFPTRCDSIEQAIGRVGFKSVQHMVGLAVARQAFQGPLKHYGITPTQVWRNAVAVSELSSSLARSPGGEPGFAHTAGLLRGIGRIVLNNFSAAVDYPGEAASPDVFAWEKGQYNFNAAEVTAVLLQHWRFSEESIATVAGLLKPQDAGPVIPAAARLQLACVLAATPEWDCGLPGEAPSWMPIPELCTLGKVDESVLAHIADEARQAFDHIMESQS